MKEVKLGADPEFLFVDNRGSIKAANSFLNGNFEQFGLGCDGCSTLAEIRPAPDTDPTQVTSNIKRILLEALIKEPRLGEYKWRAGSWYKSYALGGHIHFGHTDMKGEENILKTTDILDHILAPLVLLMESKDEASARRQGGRGYGQLRGWRSQRWGFEYRTLPSFIINEPITNGIMSIAKLIGNGVINNNIPTEWITEMKNSLSINNEAFSYCNKSVFRRGLTTRMQLVRALRGYEDYKEHIQQLYRFIKNGGQFENFNDMKENWDIMGQDYAKYKEARMVKAGTAEEVYELC